VDRTPQHRPTCSARANGPAPNLPYAANPNPAVHPAHDARGRPSSRPPAPPLRLAHAAAIAAILAILSGLNTLANDFAYDDIPIIVHNPLVTEPGRTLEIFKRHYWENCSSQHDEKRADLLYRPLAILTYRLNCITSGLHPAGYHLVNMLLHASVSALVTILAVRLGCSILGGLVAGALFAVMPIHTEAVANVVGRAELLTALAVLLAALFALHIRFDIFAVGLAWTLAAALATFAAMLSKENGAAALVLVPLLAAIGRPDSPHRRRLRTILIVVLTLAFTLVAYLLLRYQATAGRMALTEMYTRAANIMTDATPAERFWGAWQIFGMYFAKTFWPRILCMDYSYKTLSLADSPANLHVVIGIVALAGLAAAAVVWWRRDQRRLALACLAILLAYFPISNTVILRILFAERAWYLPSAFLAVVIGGLFTDWAITRRRIAVTSIVVVIAALAGFSRSWARNAEWRDNGTLFVAGYRDHPNSAQVLLGYGQWLANHGDARRGLALLNRCVEIAPEMTNAFAAIGRIYTQFGDDRQAVAALQTARMQNSGDPEIQDLLRKASDRLAAAEQPRLDRLRKRCETQPASLPLFLEWTDALQEIGKTPEAVALFAACEPRFGRSADFHRARAVALMLDGRRDEAIEAYRAALAVDPKNVDVLAELATALLDRHGTRDVRQAGVLIRQARRIAPDHPRALLAQAEWLEQSGQHQEAIAIYQHLVRNLPPGPFRSAVKTRLDVAR